MTVTTPLAEQPNTNKLRVKGIILKKFITMTNLESLCGSNDVIVWQVLDGEKDVAILSLTYSMQNTIVFTTEQSNWS